MYSTEKEFLKVCIGWEDGWEDKCNFPFVKRIINADKITNNVISILMTVFKLRGDLFSFVSFILSSDFTLPTFNDFDKMCLKLARQKNNYKAKDFKALKNKAFFKMQLSPAPLTKKRKSADADYISILNINKELSSQVDQLSSKEETYMEQMDKLKLQVIKLETEITDLNSKNKTLDTNNNSLSSQLETMSIRLGEEEQFQLILKRQLKTVHRKFASARSCNSKLLKKIKIAKESGKVNTNQNSCQICKCSVSGKDFIVVDSYLDYDNIGSTELFSGFKWIKPHNSSVDSPIVVRKNIYIKLSCAKRYSKLSRRCAAWRSKVAVIFLQLLAGSDVKSDLSMLLCDVLSCEMSILHCIGNKLGFVSQLSVSDAVELQSQLRMSTAEFRKLRRILFKRILFKRKFLSDDEIIELCQYTDLFACEFHACFPNESITRKMHELTFNVPLFVKSHKTIGLLNEEEGESLHGGVNQELRQLHSVRNQEQKLRLVLKRFELHSKADRKLQAAKVRKCVVCSEHGEKSFYRKGLCLICGHRIQL